MGFNRPSDLMVLFGIFALVIITFGFGVQSVIENYGGNSSDDDYFVSIESKMPSYRSNSINVTDGLHGTVGQSEEQTVDSVALQVWNSVRSVERTYDLFVNSTSTASAKLRLDPVYVNVMLTILLVVFAIVLYTWFRGFPR